ncbi:MAG: S-layer homology domain-containing protein [Clostridia bacterium]|nr:S-layer homology domain-containing protein [Clostridia bacterium]
MKTVKIICILICIITVITSVTIPSVAKESMPFSDVKESHWFYKAVKYTYENGIIKGMNENTFAPNVNFTRAMAVQVLSQISGDDLSAYKTTSFPDVPDGLWCVKAVAWGVDKGIVVGIDGKFKPNDSVTREQLARMIHQFAVKYDIINTFPGGATNLDKYSDKNRVGAWATEDVEWAVRNGIISGVGADKLDPKATATRAQAAQILYFLHYMSENGMLPPDTTDFDALTVKESDKPRIICWGDSMTAGYPKFLRQIAQVGTKGYSSSGEIAEYIAMKQGGIPFYAAPFTIPASNDAVRVQLLGPDFEDIDTIAAGSNAGLAPAYIGGIEGNIYFDSEDYCHYFIRKDAPPYKEVNINRVTRVVSLGMRERQTNDIHVIFSGPSNLYTCDEAYKLIEIQRKMTDYLGTDRYVIISITCLEYMPGLPKFNADLAEEYGDHFLDFRSYLLERGLEDAGLTPTEQDLKDIARGEIPESLRSDEEHGNEYYDRLLAQQVYEKLLELGYLEVQN